MRFEHNNQVHFEFELFPLHSGMVELIELIMLSHYLETKTSMEVVIHVLTFGSELVVNVELLPYKNEPSIH